MPIEPDQYMAGRMPSLSRGGGWLPPLHLARPPLHRAARYSFPDTRASLIEPIWSPPIASPKVSGGMHGAAWYDGGSMFAPTHYGHLPHRYATEPGNRSKSGVGHIPATRRPPLGRRALSQPDTRQIRVTEQRAHTSQMNRRRHHILVDSHTVPSWSGSSSEGSDWEHAPLAKLPRPSGYASPNAATYCSDSPSVLAYTPELVTPPAAPILQQLPYGIPEGRSRIEMSTKPAGPRWVQARPPPITIGSEYSWKATEWRAAGGAWH